MKQQKLVECGRCVYIESGKHRGKIAFIVNPIDEKTLVIDGPSTLVPRHVTHLNLLKLSKIVIPISHTSTSKQILKVLDETKAVEKWNSSNFAIKYGDGKGLDLLNCRTGCLKAFWFISSEVSRPPSSHDAYARGTTTLSLTLGRDVYRAFASWQGEGPLSPSRKIPVSTKIKGALLIEHYSFGSIV
ncbi:hypothetical protein HZS_1786, partial [Henneguya salminicola]